MSDWSNSPPDRKRHTLIGRTNLRTHEGWDVFETSEGYLEIQRCDEIRKFPTDASAVAFVMARAAEGSQPHMDALARVIASKCGAEQE